MSKAATIIFDDPETATALLPNRPKSKKELLGLAALKILNQEEIALGEIKDFYRQVADITSHRPNSKTALSFTRNISQEKDSGKFIEKFAAFVQREILLPNAIFLFRNPDDQHTAYQVVHLKRATLVKHKHGDKTYYSGDLDEDRDINTSIERIDNNLLLANHAFYENLVDRRLADILCETRRSEAAPVVATAFNAAFSKLDAKSQDLLKSMIAALLKHSEVQALICEDYCRSTGPDYPATLINHFKYNGIIRKSLSANQKKPITALAIRQIAQNLEKLCSTIEDPALSSVLLLGVLAIAEDTELGNESGTATIITSTSKFGDLIKESNFCHDYINFIMHKFNPKTGMIQAKILLDNLVEQEFVPDLQANTGRVSS